VISRKIYHTKSRVGVGVLMEGMGEGGEESQFLSGSQRTCKRKKRRIRKSIEKLDESARGRRGVMVKRKRGGRGEKGSPEKGGDSETGDAKAWGKKKKALPCREKKEKKIRDNEKGSARKRATNPILLGGVGGGEKLRTERSPFSPFSSAGEETGLLSE